ncbi:hypothetical protein O181_086723 [Austropuccinia psidii MF-1]|uniref:Uncharacterized protein n=1 Tax=Austropuccinia psidii MF-1 TaxID=1389203 RepID=A0A9Q3FVK1_9BASI|nr:hypothetical protein [Austropuccinia psidii MF-1]
MDALNGFHQDFLMPITKKLLIIITHCGIYEYLIMLDKDWKDASFVNALDEVWKNSYSEGRFNLFYGIHQGESRVNRRQLTSRQANVKQDKSRAHVKQTLSTRPTLVLHQIL